MLEAHDKSKFEIFGFYFSNKDVKNDKWHERIKKTFDNFYDVTSKSSSEIVKLSHDLKIDISVDLMVYTGDADNKIDIFLKRCAPIQVNFLGYPGTSGIKSIDYIVADKTLIPKENQKFFSEKIVYMPHSYMPNQKNKEISKKNFSKKDLNLPEKKFIFCCFNSPKKNFSKCI